VNQSSLKAQPSINDLKKILFFRVQQLENSIMKLGSARNMAGPGLLGLVKLGTI
jgi:hypothetical protein